MDLQPVPQVSAVAVHLQSHDQNLGAWQCAYAVLMIAEVLQLSSSAYLFPYLCTFGSLHSAAIDALDDLCSFLSPIAKHAHPGSFEAAAGHMRLSS